MDKIHSVRQDFINYKLPSREEAARDAARYFEIRGKVEHRAEIDLLRNKAHAHVEGMLNTRAGTMTSVDQLELFEPYNAICADEYS